MKRVSIRDVAKEAGVSITTVSKALNAYPDVNPETRKRIEEVVRRMNYVPDAAGRAMGGKAGKVIGLLINDLKPMDPSGAVYGILSGVYHACQHNEVEFLLMTTDSQTQKTYPLKTLCLSKRLTGLVCSGFRLDDAYLRQLDTIDIPCAFVDTHTGHEGVLDVTMDNEHAAMEAVEFLIKNGRKKIALMNGTAQADVAVLRGRGYRLALEKAGLPLHPHWMMDADFDESTAYRMAVEFLRENPETDAFFCASDLMALGVCRAIEETGKTVGQEIAVVGFDDIPIAKYLYGGLTTVRQDFYLMGYMVGQAVYKRIEASDEEAAPGNLMYELVVRGSAPGLL